MDDSSDFEDIQLYTKTEENIRKKREQFVLKIEEFEHSRNVIQVSKDSDVEDESLMDILLKDDNQTKGQNACNISPKPKHIRKNSRRISSKKKSLTNFEEPKTNKDCKIVLSESDGITSVRNAYVPSVSIHKEGVRFVVNKEDEEPPLPPKRVLRSSSKPQTRTILNLKPKRTRQTKSSNSNNRAKRSCRADVNQVCDLTTSSTTDKSLPSNTVEDCRKSKEQVIILDDDSDFLNSSLSPIVFNKRKSKHLNSFAKDIQDSSGCEGILRDDDSIKINIEWYGKSYSIMHFQLLRTEEFETIFEKLAEQEGVPTCRIELKRMSQLITPTDTPKSLKLMFHAALKGCICHTDIDFSGINNLSGKESSNEVFTVHMKLESQEKLTFTINRHEKISILYKKCSNKLKCEENLIRITFDGDYADPTELLSSLDLEDGDMFNVHLAQKSS